MFLMPLIESTLTCVEYQRCNWAKCKCKLDGQKQNGSL